MIFFNYTTFQKSYSLNGKDGNSPIVIATAVSKHIHRSEILRHFGKLINRVLSRFGLELTNKSFNLAALLDQYNIDLVVDIGANKGQFASNVFATKFKGHLISIEPQKEANEILKKKAQKFLNWEILQPVAISDFDGHANFRVSENSQSSSLLAITTKHTSAAPHAAVKGERIVSVRTLDSYLLKKIEPYSNILLKIDVQGGERAVLEGGKSFLEKTLLIQLELSLSEMYHGESLFSSQYQYLCDLGFRLIDFHPVFRDPNSKELLQFDGLFLNSKIHFG